MVDWTKVRSANTKRKIRSTRIILGIPSTARGSGQHSMRCHNSNIVNASICTSIRIRITLHTNRKKFGNQTSDNMDRWKSRGGKSQRKESEKEEDQRRKRVRRKKMQVGKEVEKSPKTVFFQCFGAPDGRKVGSLKRRVRSHLAR